MRRLLLLFAPAAIGFPALLACEQDPVSGPTFEAGVGDVYVPPHEAGANVPGDASDASQDPPTPLGVTVRVTRSTGPKANAPVIFHDAAGAVLETKLTGADGKATSSRPEVSMATAVLAFDSELRHLVTWTGVELGDELDVREPEEDVMLGSYSVTLADLPQEMFPGTLRSGWCAGKFDSNDGGILMMRRCVESKGAVLATARNANLQIVGHAFAKGNPAPASGAPVAVTTGEWKPAKTLDVVVSNFGNTIATARVYEIADGQLFPSGEQPVAENKPEMFVVADGFADAHLVSVETMGNQLSTSRRLMKRMAPAAAAVTMDANLLLPEITSASLDETDPMRPTVTWSFDPDTTIDGGIVRIHASNDDGLLPWSFVVAPGSTSVTVPELPAQAVESILQGGSLDWTGDIFAELVEADAVPSYTELRRTTIWPGGGDNNFVAEWAFSADGTYRTTALQPIYF